jgi:hypothetical protein
VIAEAKPLANLPAPMRLEDFFQAFFAALRLQDAQFIDTRGDHHQRRFSRVAEWLDEHPDVSDRLGVCFFPSPYNGRHAEFDAALLKKQVGLLGAKNPFYPGVNLQFSRERAEAILESCPPEDRALFDRLAEVFLDADTFAHA